MYSLLYTLHAILNVAASCGSAVAGYRQLDSRSILGWVNRLVANCRFCT